MAYSHSIILWDSGAAWKIKLSDLGQSLIVHDGTHSQTSENINVVRRYFLTVDDSTQLQTSETRVLNDHNPGNTVLSNVGSFNLTVQAAGGNTSYYRSWL